MNDSVKKVSKKKMVFVQIDEEITSVFERTEKLPYKEIYLVVPRRAVLLQSVVNLKILKQKLEDVEKQLAIITNDPNGMKLAIQAEIKVFDEWNVDADVSTKEEKDPSSALLKPIAATQNDVEDHLPSRLPKKKSSIFDVVKQLKNKEKGFSLRAYMSDLRKNRLERQSLRVTPGRKRWMLAFLLASASVFFVILYVALPGATIAIEPSSDVVTKTLNVTMATTPREQEDIKAYVVESTVQVRLTHSSSGIENRGVNAKGTITVKNTSAEDRTLIAQTRFQTDAGLVFRIQKEVTVPGGSVEHPGTLDVMVVADAADANGAPVGDRGNIGPSHFFLPGLKEDSRNILYGESSAPMTGGTSEIVTHVTEEDLKAAQNEAEEELQKAALADLRKEVLTVGNREGLNLKLLEDTDTLTFGTPTITVPYAELGKEKSSFEITGSLQVSGIAYDSDALYSLLKTEIVSVQTPGKQLISVDRDSISLSVLEANAGSYKVTASIQGVEEYQINPDLEGGLELSEKIKEHVAGRSIEEAQAYVENLPEVNTVDISVWPMWSPALPSLPENIKIKSLSTGEALQ